VRPGLVHLITRFIVRICLPFGIVESLHCLLHCLYGSPRFFSDF
jgi:hypothetical protein